MSQQLMLSFRLISLARSLLLRYRSALHRAWSSWSRLVRKAPLVLLVPLVQPAYRVLQALPVQLGQGSLGQQVFRGLLVPLVRLGQRVRVLRGRQVQLGQ
jgi:hypothetical protein